MKAAAIATILVMLTACGSDSGPAPQPVLEPTWIDIGPGEVFFWVCVENCPEL